MMSRIHTFLAAMTLTWAITAFAAESMHDDIIFEHDYKPYKQSKNKKLLVLSDKS